MPFADGHGGELGIMRAHLQLLSTISESYLGRTHLYPLNVGVCQGLLDLDHCDTIWFLAAVPLRLLAGKGLG